MVQFEGQRISVTIRGIGSQIEIDGYADGPVLIRYRRPNRRCHPSPAEGNGKERGPDESDRGSDADLEKIAPRAGGETSTQQRMDPALHGTSWAQTQRVVASCAPLGSIEPERLRLVFAAPRGSLGPRSGRLGLRAIAGCDWALPVPGGQRFN